MLDARSTLALFPLLFLPVVSGCSAPQGTEGSLPPTASASTAATATSTPTGATASASAASSNASGCAFVLGVFGANDGSLHLERYGFKTSNAPMGTPVTEGGLRMNIEKLDGVLTAYDAGRANLDAKLAPRADAFAVAARSRSKNLRIILDKNTEDAKQYLRKQGEKFANESELERKIDFVIEAKCFPSFVPADCTSPELERDTAALDAAATDLERACANAK